MIRTVVIPAAVLIALSACSIEDILFHDLPRIQVDIGWPQVEQPGFTADWNVDGPIEGTKSGEFDADGLQSITFWSHCEERGIDHHMIYVSGRWEGSSETCFDSFYIPCGSSYYRFTVREPDGKGCEPPGTG